MNLKDMNKMLHAFYLSLSFFLFCRVIIENTKLKWQYLGLTLLDKHLFNISQYDCTASTLIASQKPVK